MAAEEKTFLLETPDSMNFVVSEREARQSWSLKAETACYHGEPIDVNIVGETLAKVLHYCKKHAYSDGHDLRAWDAKFVADLDLDALYDLILASSNLEIEGLLALTCQTLATKIKGKSPREICDVLNIRGVFTPELHVDHSSGSCASHTICHVAELGVPKSTDLVCALKLPVDGQESISDQPLLSSDVLLFTKHKSWYMHELLKVSSW